MPHYGDGSIFHYERVPSNLRFYDFLKADITIYQNPLQKMRIFTFWLFLGEGGGVFTQVRKSLAGLQETNDVAQAVNALIIQAADMAFPVSRGRTQFRIKSPLWYDAECRHLRGLAIHAGERLTHAIDDNDELIDECRQYRASKQRKKRSFGIAKLPKLRMRVTGTLMKCGKYWNYRARYSVTEINRAVKN